jgi:hypothetical protein
MGGLYLKRLISSSNNNELAIAEYESRKYEDLSKEFKEKAGRVCDLIELMYNRLTLVDKLSYKQAITKIRDDHADIPGFSLRNISRNLPLDNPTVPRRVTPRCHNSSPTHNAVAERLSITELQEGTNSQESHNNENVIEPKDHKESCKENVELEEVIVIPTAKVTTNKIPSTGLTFKISKLNYEIVRIAMNSSNEYIRLIFDMGGTFEYAESDIIK